MFTVVLFVAGVGSSGPATIERQRHDYDAQASLALAVAIVQARRAAVRAREVERATVPDFAPRYFQPHYGPPAQSCGQFG